MNLARYDKDRRPLSQSDNIFIRSFPYVVTGLLFAMTITVGTLMTIWWYKGWWP